MVRTERYCSTCKQKRTVWDGNISAWRLLPAATQPSCPFCVERHLDNVLIQADQLVLDLGQQLADSTAELQVLRQRTDELRTSLRDALNVLQSAIQQVTYHRQKMQRSVDETVP